MVNIKRGFKKNQSIG